MFGPWQSLSKKVRDVVVACDMLDAELVALDTVLQPVKAHVDAFRQARRDRPVRKTHGDLIIAKEERGGLRAEGSPGCAGWSARCRRAERQRRERHTPPPAQRNRLQG